MDLTAELRRRLGVPATTHPDDYLEHFLEVAANLLGPWLVDDPEPYRANVDEATVQLAIKVIDASPRGLVAASADGTWDIPSPAATPGMVRGVFGALGPALATGGVSV